MSTRYFALLTNVGAAKLANATALGIRLNITQMAVGDGGGVLPTPNPTQTALVSEKRRAAINTLSTDPANPNQIISEQVIPENEGGWWIREVGLFDDAGDMIAIANCPETYKPQLQEGSGRIQTVRMILIVSSTDAVTLKIDPAVVLATRSYVDSAIDTHEKSRKHPDGTLTAKGFVQLSNSTSSESEVLAATSKAVKAANDNANSRLPSGGTAVAATKLATARKIAGVAFDGTADITLSGAVLLLRGAIGNSDLDTLVGFDYQGHWTQTSTANATAARHYPVVSAGHLDVSYNDVAGYGTVQKYTTHVSNRIFIRSKPVAVDPWTDWVEIWTSANLVKQTSQDDTTAGSVVLNGGHGLGANARPRAAGATGGAAGCNFFSYTANHADNPFGGTGASGIHVQEAATYGWDLLGRNGGGIDFRVRQVSNGAASSWSALWTTANLANPMTTDTAQTISSIKTFTQYPRALGYHVRTAEATPRDVAYLRGLPADQSKAELFANLSSLFLRSPTDIYVSVNCGYTGNTWYKTDASKESRVLSFTTGGLTVSSSPAGNPEAIVRTDPILVRGINAVTDANGFYKAPNSTGDTISTSDIAGIPLPFPAAVAPTGWLKCNGQTFDKTLYPILASRYPSGVLPDLRGEFVRGWDDGRGADASRALLSAQGDAIRNITGIFNPGGNGVSADSKLFTAGPWGQASNSGAAGDSALITFDASKVVPTATENRPRNIAFNYIVRAA